MSLPEDLRMQAHHLVELDVHRPKQANLRRAISTAYYALFHLLAADCVLRIGLRVPEGLSPRIARSLVHAEMKEVCQSISSGNPSAVLRELQPGGFSSELQKVANIFVKLQEARHRADYDLSATYKRSNIREALELADEAFLSWRKVRQRDEATVFLSALLFAKRWSK